MRRVMVTNLYGGSNTRGPAVRDWIKDVDPNVALISELGRLDDDLNNIGRVIKGNQSDIGILVCKGKVDEADVVKLTDHIHRKDRPLFWRARYYIRVRINKDVYYCTHGNAAISNNGRWLDNKGADEWREGMRKLKAAMDRDISRGYDVVVGGDFNFGDARPPAQLSPRDVFQDLGLNWMRHNVDWLAWDPRYNTLENKRVLGKAPGADAHHTLVATLEDRENAQPEPEREGGGSQPGRNKAGMDIITTPVARLSNPDLRDELTKIIAQSPEIVMVQGVEERLGILRSFEGYGVAAGRRRKHAVIYKRATYRLIGASEHKAQDDTILVANLLHRNSDTDISVVTTAMDVRGEKSRRELTMFAKLVKERGASGRLVFWGGHFDIDPDRAKIFDDNGLESAFGELGKDPDTNSFIGSYKGDSRVKAKVAVRQRIGGRVLSVAKFTIATLKKPDQPRDEDGTAKDPDPKPRQTFERDNGATIDHTDCCGGYSE